MSKIYLTLLITVALSACATSYQKISHTGGYSETRLDKNVFIVSFNGNGYTSVERARDFALLRSAELTLENDYMFFATFDENDRVDTSFYKTPESYDTNVNLNTYGNQTYGTATTRKSGGKIYTSSKPQATLKIVCFVDKPNKVFAYDANFIKDSIEKKYQIGKYKK